MSDEIKTNELTAEETMAEKGKQLEELDARIAEKQADLKKLDKDLKKKEAAAKKAQESEGTEARPVQAQERAMVEIIIPKTTLTDDQPYYVGINGVNYSLPKNKRVQVPEHVAEEIYRSMSAMNKQEQNMKELLSIQTIQQII